MSRLALPTIATVTITTPVVSFTPTLQRLHLLLQSEQCAPDHLAGLIGSDPMLTMSVLSKANISNDRAHETIDQLKPAISLLGLNQVAGLVKSVIPVSEQTRNAWPPTGPRPMPVVAWPNCYGSSSNLSTVRA